MRKIYLLLLLITGFAFGQVSVVGTATYELKLSNGYVGFWGSSCGDAITGGLQWIAAEYDSPESFSTMVQGTVSYPNYGNGLANQAFGPKSIFFKEDNKIINLKIGTTHRDRGNTGCKSTDYNSITVPLTTNFYSRNLNFEDLGMNQPGNVLATVTPIIDLTNPFLENNIIGTKSSIVIPPIEGVLDQYYNWMYHIDGDMTGYIVMEPDPDCDGGYPILLKMNARIIDPDNPPIDCPDIRVTKYKDKWISLPSGYQNKNFLNIKCKDFLPFSVVGKKVQLKVNDNGKLVDLRYRLSAPIVESFVATESKCYGDSESGSVRFVFDDTLMPGEQLNYSLLDVKTNTPTSYNGPLIIGQDKSFVISNLARGRYELQLVGFKDGLITDVNVDKFPLQRFEIGSPFPVDFKLSKTDVRCKGGTDGTITINASGGTGKGYQYSINNGSWTPFKNIASTTETINGLFPPAGLSITYNIRVKDANECIAKIQTVVEGEIKLGVELSTPITISQPPTAISLTDTPPFLQQPTFHGAANGSITVSFTGGTPIAGNSYSFEWVNANYTTAVLASKTSTQFGNGIYAITLKNVAAGTYNLTVKDANGCTLNPVSQPKLAIVLNEPDPIEIKLAITKPISCNTDNFDPTTGNELKLADGTITATITGGVPLSVNDNHGLLYYYTWKKQLPDNTWVALDESNFFLANLSAANYSLNVTDKIGITQGTYSTTALIQAVPTEIAVVEPDPLDLTFTPTPVSCYNGNNGSAIANVTGGAGGYTYKWGNTNGIKTKSGLIEGSYFVEIKDNNGCSTQGSVLITQPPSQVSINYTKVDNPKFSGATNGKIVVEVTGGTLKDDNSYGYQWKNSKGDTKVATPNYDVVSKVYTLTLDNLSADEYSLTVWDKNYDADKPAQIVNCSVLDSKITLEQPKPLVVTFEVKQTISCNASNEFGSAKDTEPADGKRDESQDGILVAHVTGGIQLLTADNNGLPYYFYWKKQQTDGNWIDWNDQDETAEHLSHGNYALNIKDANGIVLGNYGVDNELITAKDSIQFMKEPSLFDVSIAKGDVYCNGGNDGWATATVVGGTAPYQYDWSNGETISENTILKADDYSIVINDDKKCIAEEKVTILEPIDPITLNYTAVINPTFYKATNGKIVVEVKGGTPFGNKSYGYEWKNSVGKLQTVTSQVINGVYTLTLNGLPEDVYTLTIKDANYNPATNKIGCTVVNSTQTLDDPEPLIVTFEVKRTISCNVSNQFGNEIDTIPNDGQRDESQDGILVAHVTGGIQLTTDQNNGLPYFYTWKKQLANKSWISWNDYDETAENLSDGIYALNIEDKNGIKLGTYVNNLLSTEIDVTQDMPEPPKLEVTFTKFDVGCTVGNDGWAKADVTGGTAPYTYQWTNEGTTDKIENLTTNNYFVIITDAKGCSVQGSIFVGDPNGIIATETTKNPTCFQGNDGTINLDVKGGNLPYIYKWNTGATTKDITQLKAGNYEVTITCPECCVYKKYFTLKDPAPIVVNLGADRTLCNAQSLDLDATILDTKAQYSWTATNGFIANTPKVNLTKAGVYHVKVTSGLGCIGEDDIEIKTNNIDISSEFFLSSQAYLDEEVILVNASNPFGENTQWIIPENVNVVEQKEKFITLKFNKIGVYSIALKQTQGDCYALYSKNISVEPRSTLPNAVNTNTHFINDFIVSPNPNDGNFNALINLESNSPINLRLFSYNGQYTLVQKKDSGKKNYAVDFNVKLASGVYVLVLETAQQTLVKKIIIY